MPFYGLMAILGVLCALGGCVEGFTTYGQATTAFQQIVAAIFILTGWVGALVMVVSIGLGAIYREQHEANRKAAEERQAMLAHLRASGAVDTRVQ
jgi:hypothetical protein